MRIREARRIEVEVATNAGMKRIILSAPVITQVELSEPADETSIKSFHFNAFQIIDFQ
jgi:hypothetical protein